MKHLDLFAGIGGFSLAVDMVWENAEHIFCEIDPFCQAILKKHWPNSLIYGDVKEFTKERFLADTKSRKSWKQTEQERGEDIGGGNCEIDLLTGGFPCQPVSQAGRRRGTEDDRWLWPEMLRVIREFSPRWVIAENVRGLLTIQQGMVFEQVCSDLEGAGYEVVPFIIPACAVNAPHRRDRIWIVAYSISQRAWNKNGKASDERGRTRKGGKEGLRQVYRTTGTNRIDPADSDVQDTISKRTRWRVENNGQVLESESTKTENAGSSWEEDWPEVATRLCSVDDELSPELDTSHGRRNPLHSWWRQESLKAYGNAIVPKVATEIMKAIKKAEEI